MNSTASQIPFFAESMTPADYVKELLRHPKNLEDDSPLNNAISGLQSIMAQFDVHKQHCIQQLIFERIDVLTRLSIEESRLAGIPQNIENPPEIAQILSRALKNNAVAICNLAKEFSDEIFYYIDEIMPYTEELADNTINLNVNESVSRRKIATKISSVLKMDPKYRHSSHDSVTRTGKRNVFNELNARTGTEGLSYYERQQLRYGRGRAGSPSVSRAWENLFDESGNMLPVDSEPLPLSEQRYVTRAASEFHATQDSDSFYRAPSESGRFSYLNASHGETDADGQSFSSSIGANVPIAHRRSPSMGRRSPSRLNSSVGGASTVSLRAAADSSVFSPYGHMRGIFRRSGSPGRANYLPSHGQSPAKTLYIPPTGWAGLRIPSSPSRSMFRSDSVYSVPQSTSPGMQSTSYIRSHSVGKDSNYPDVGSSSRNARSFPSQEREHASNAMYSQNYHASSYENSRPSSQYAESKVDRYSSTRKDIPAQ